MNNYTYAILCITYEKINFKDIFFLKVGENTLGCDVYCDISIKIEGQPIDLIHAKIIVDEHYCDIAIQDISLSNSILKLSKGQKIPLKKRKEYELSNKKIFYLTKDVKLFLVEGNFSQINQFLIDNDLSYYSEILKDKINDFKNNSKEIAEDIKSISITNAQQQLNNFDELTNIENV